jgi:hypothetical protein
MGLAYVTAERAELAKEVAHFAKLEIIPLRVALEEVRDTPFSMVNDSDSLRHTIRTIQAIANQALRPSR